MLFKSTSFLNNYENLMFLFVEIENENVIVVTNF